MTIQEKIKEGLAKILIDKGFQGITIGEQRDFLLRFLHSQGVVIKVDRELPQAPIPCPEPVPNDTYFYRGWERCKSDMADLVAVEPLIEE